VGVVHVLVAGEPPENRLAQQSGQPMTTILASARVGKHLSPRVSQTDRIIQFAIRQQSGIGGDRRTAKLEHQAAVEIEPQRTPVRFTRRVRHCCPGWSPKATFTAFDFHAHEGYEEIVDFNYPLT